MLTLKKEKDIKLMKNYYRASDMIDFWCFFPNSSPLLDLAVVMDEEDYINNKGYLDKFDSYRVDTLKPYTLVSGVESDGGKTDFIELFKKIKKMNNNNVVTFFDLKGNGIQEANGGIGIIPYVYDEAKEYYYQIWLANTANMGKNLRDYLPKTKEVVITVPKRQRRNLFPILEESENDE